MTALVAQRALLFVRWCAWLVPADRRTDWRRQWEGDLLAQAGFLLADDRSADHVRRDLFR